MTSDPVVQWAVTGVFIALSAHSLWRLVAARKPFVGLGYLFHLGMNLGMVAMVWPWWTRLAALPQLAFFVVAAAFFAAAAGWHAVDTLSQGPASGRRRTSHHRDARAQAVHAVMMLAMVWAVAVMSRTHSVGAQHIGHGAGRAQLGAWATVAGAVLAAALVAGGALFLVYLARHLRERGSVLDRTGTDYLASALASFGTVAMCGLMLVG